MKLFKLIKNTVAMIALAGAAVGAHSSDQAEAPLNLEVHRADGNSFHVGSVIVTGKTEAALIDGQFTLADAHEIVAKILRTGKKLTTIYISHGDPDYYFGLEVITAAFPEAKVFSTQKTLDHIKATADKKLGFWGPKLGANGPSNVVFPTVLKGDSFKVDGHKLNIIGLDKHPKHTFVWIPSIKAVVGGIPVFGDLHLWMADSKTKQERQQWLTILDRITALKPTTVIPGHALPTAPQTLKSVNFSRKYIKAYEQQVEKTKDSKALIKAMKTQYPEAGLDIALDIGAKVVKGEMKW